MKKLLTIVILICIAMSGVIGYNVYQNKKRQEIYDSLTIELKEDIVIEYGDKIDATSLINSFNGELTVPSIDTNTIGKQEVVFRVSNEDITRDYIFEVEVADTKKPIISLKKEKVELEYGASFKINDYIKSIKDEVDGELEYKETIQNNSYTYETKVDTKKEGIYENKIIATDKNGNKTEKILTVVVKEEANALDEEETVIQSTKPIVPNNKVIVIDAGHQGKANTSKEAVGPGSSTKKAKVSGGATGVSSKKTESQINLEVALKLRDELKSRGYSVVMTRTTQNVNISNQQRAQIGNDNKAGAVIHIHCDSLNDSSIKGAHTIAITKNNPYTAGTYNSSSKLAKNVINSYCSATGIKNRGVSYRDDLTGLNWSLVPSIYIELGFISNPSEDRNLADSSFQKKCAKGIANGIDNYFK